MKSAPKICIVLEDIRSIHNAGSIFRTADCLGIQEILLVGTTPAPLDRFGRPLKDFANVSLGAEQSVSWRYFKTINQALAFLKKHGLRIIAVEQAEHSTDYKKIEIFGPTAFIFGNEVSGISQKALAQCDAVAEIAMRGAKESLNVSVAVGIALARMLNR